ncbi:MAG: DUF5808 domain-containing protein [Segetibacter sp.]
MTTNEKPGKETFDEWHNDPSNWKWGEFYYNKNDKRLFPPKRIKEFGWTVNFANPISVLAFLVLLILIIVLSQYLQST